MDKLATKEMTKFGLLSLGIALAVVTAYHFVVVAPKLASKDSKEEKEEV